MTGVTGVTWWDIKVGRILRLLEAIYHECPTCPTCKALTCIGLILIFRSKDQKITPIHVYQKQVGQVGQVGHHALGRHKSRPTMSHLSTKKRK